MAVTNPVAVPAGSGFTGARAQSIVAEFVPVSSVGVAIEETFTYYVKQLIPTSVRLPCTGTSTVLFAPRPGGHAARNTRVAVTFVATCGSPVCPVGGRRPPARS